MRTARNVIRTRRLALAASGFLTGLLFLSPALHAADAVAAPLVVTTTTTTAAPAPATPVPAPLVAASSMPDTPPLITSSDKEEKGGKGLTNAEDKVTDNIKGVVKHIGTTDNLTLEDLNSARQAVAKIDALIDIEKRLGELEKLRNEREGGGNRTMSAIPASALAPFPMPSAQPMQAMPVQQASFQPAMMNSTEVVRIIGGAGRYNAVMKTPDGQTKTVQVGDHLNGGKIIAISSAGVELEQNGHSHLIKIHDVDTVFGHSVP